MLLIYSRRILIGARDDKHLVVGREWAIAEYLQQLSRLFLWPVPPLGNFHDISEKVEGQLGTASAETVGQGAHIHPSNKRTTGRDQFCRAVVNLRHSMTSPLQPLLKKQSMRDKGFLLVFCTHFGVVCGALLRLLAPWAPRLLSQ